MINPSEDQKVKAFKEKKRARFLFVFQLQGWGKREEPGTGAMVGVGQHIQPFKVRPCKAGVLHYAVT